jgi:hypothetical protein
VTRRTARLTANVEPETMMVQPAFRKAVDAVDASCARRFGKRLVGAYVAGSVGQGEALPGISDLDWWAFIHDEPTAADSSWRSRLEKRLGLQFAVFTEVHVNLRSLERLGCEEFSRFILRYNSLRVRGENVVALLERSGYRTPRPSRKLAKSRLPFVRKCLGVTLAGGCPPALSRLPEDPFLAARKLARNFMVVEGAFLLMSQGSFRSFRQNEVLSGLMSVAGRWNKLINASRRILTDPIGAAIGPTEFMGKARPFVEWMLDKIETS